MGRGGGEGRAQGRGDNLTVHLSSPCTLYSSCARQLACRVLQMKYLSAGTTAKHRLVVLTSQH